MITQLFWVSVIFIIVAIVFVVAALVFSVQYNRQLRRGDR